jgi:hypothetical protein
MACILQSMAQAVAAASLVERFTLDAQAPMVIIASDELRLQGQFTRQGVDCLGLDQSLYGLVPKIAMLRFAKALHLGRPRLIQATLLLHPHGHTHYAMRRCGANLLTSMGMLIKDRPTVALVGLRWASSIRIVIMNGQHLARRKVSPRWRKRRLALCHRLQHGLQQGRY